MRIPSGKTDVYLYFVAVDATDLKTRETGLSSFTVYRSRNGAAEVAYTTPTITEIDSTNMPGVYALLVDEDTTITSGADSEEVCVHITATGMAPVTRTFELYRPIITSGQTIDVSSGGVEVGSFQTGAITAAAFAAGAIDNAAIASNAIGAAEIADGAITAAKIATDAIDADAIADGAITSGVFAAGAITASAIAADAITDAKVASDVTIASVTGAVGSVTGNVGGNVTGSVGSVATGGITAASFAADAITAAKVAADVGTEIATAVWANGTRVLTAGTNIALAKGTGVTGFNDLSAADVRTAVGLASANLDTQLDALPTNAELNARTLASADYATATALATVDTVADAIKVVTDKLDTALELDGSVYRYTTNALEQAPTGGSAPTAAEIADAVWEEAIADHSGTAGSTAEALNAAGAAGDPWTTVLPGAYGAGSAGSIIGNNLNATVSSRATQASVDTVDSVADAIKAKTDSLTFTVAGQVDSNIQYVNDSQITGAGTEADPWGP